MYDLSSVDVLRERLQASYSEAKEALDATNGDVVAALAYLEEKREREGGALANLVKSLVDEVGSVVSEKEVKSAEVLLAGRRMFMIPLAVAGIAAGVVVLVSTLVNECRIEVTTGEREDEESGCIRSA